MRRSEEANAMVDWTILTPTFLTAAVEWAGAVATVLAVGPTKEPKGDSRDRPGMSAFAIEDGVVYHSYSTYSRGLDGLWGMYQWLDRAPNGRNEKGVWWRRHDEYDNR
jgi:predicted dithiol-disulfide oxidoreductase (DUF899 family)